jgi:transposase
MKISQEQYKVIESYLPKQRGNVRMDNMQFISALMYVTENGCKWRGLPKEYGNWHSVYVKMKQWSKRGVLEDC